MADWDSAEQTFLTAAAKVYAALKISHPSGNYGTDIVVTLNIDGSQYSCRCDCTGVIQCIIKVMGYNPNWGSSPRGGDGFFLAEATSNFVKDSDGNISSDWEVIAFNAADVRPGDIRAASSHSHCDIFVDYVDGIAYGLNAGSGPNTGGQAIPKSCAAGEKYLGDQNQADLAATKTIQDSDTAKVLRYVKGRGQSGTSGMNTSQSSSQSLKAIDIELKFLQKVEFYYNLRNSNNEFELKIPGFFPVSDLIVDETGRTADSSYSDCWIEFNPTYVFRYTLGESDAEWRKLIKEGLVMMFTLDNSDPLLYGRTLSLNEDGTNDYEGSKNYTPLIRTQFPVHFRCVITDVATHSKDFGRSSAYFTNESDSSGLSLSSLVKASKNSQFLKDASGNLPESEDAHGYLFIHDEEEPYEKHDYYTWVKGMED